MFLRKSGINTEWRNDSALFWVVTILWPLENFTWGAAHHPLSEASLFPGQTNSLGDCAPLKRPSLKNTWLGWDSSALWNSTSWPMGPSFSLGFSIKIFSLDCIRALQWNGTNRWYISIYYKELAHVTIEAERSHISRMHAGDPEKQMVEILVQVRKTWETGECRWCKPVWGQEKTDVPAREDRQRHPLTFINWKLSCLSLGLAWVPYIISWHLPSWG